MGTVASSTTTPDVNYVATDGIKVYWAAFDAYSSNNSFVFATNVSNDAFSTFANSVSYTPVYRTAINTISYVNAANSLISGLAVQKTGNYLFVARAGLNQLQVLDKSTGALVQTLAFVKPKSLSIDNADNLWMVSDSTIVSKYTVNVDGTISTAVLSIGGLLDPLSIQVSANGNVIAIADGSTSQQVKFFSTSTASSTYRHIGPGLSIVFDSGMPP